MSRECSICGKAKATGNNVSHSNRHTRRTFDVNVQKVDTDNGRKYVCTRCLRTMKKDNV